MNGQTIIEGMIGVYCSGAREVALAVPGGTDCSGTVVVKGDGFKERGVEYGMEFRRKCERVDSCDKCDLLGRRWKLA
jgi:hypothetical protein